ncbi:lytic transglycosylase domain-containing protein [Mesorhizobium sp. M0276]|uniref:lytic transglycosylase domain-containing protein n=1 Tax=Mesorhizobium sp. M0276 TaxID=2956928 RepID=UPI00333CB43D
MSNIGESASAARQSDEPLKPVKATAYQPMKVTISPEEAGPSSLGKVARADDITAIPLEGDRFSERFGEGWSSVDIVNNTAPAKEAPEAVDGSMVVAYAPEAEPALGREQAVRSSIEVFSYGGLQEEMANGPSVDEATVLKDAVTSSWKEPRPDLLEGVPAEYAKLVTTISAEEGVDPNLMLSIMRVENVGFDPQAVSSAGAIGLMQVMPKVGEAFGATDLTEPSENIRVGARFLRVLVEKYRNLVLIASAYNAGEPRVDVRRSLPLIQETADYATRVVGLYTNMSSTDEVFTIRRGASAAPTAKKAGGRSGRAERAKSPMLVFSVGSTGDASGRVEQESGQVPVSGPVKIKKEEVHQ